MQTVRERIYFCYLFPSRFPSFADPILFPSFCYLSYPFSIQSFFYPSPIFFDPILSLSLFSPFPIHLRSHPFAILLLSISSSFAIPSFFYIFATLFLSFLFPFSLRFLFFFDPILLLSFCHLSQFSDTQPPLSHQPKEDDGWERNNAVIGSKKSKIKIWP